jgi:hypothetical protein
VRFHLSGYNNSQNSRVWSATSPHNIQDTRLHVQKLGVWCAMSNSLNRPHVFQRQYLDGTLFWSASLPLHYHLNEDASNMMVLLHSPWRYCAMYAGTVTRSYTPWLLSVGSSEGRNLQRQSSHPLELNGVIANFIRDTLQIELTCAFANKIRHVNASLQARGGYFQKLV